MTLCFSDECQLRDLSAIFADFRQQFFKVELVFTDLRGVFLLLVSNANESGTHHVIKIKHLQKDKSTNLALLRQRIWHFLGCESTNLAPTMLWPNRYMLAVTNAPESDWPRSASPVP